MTPEQKQLLSIEVFNRRMSSHVGKEFSKEEEEIFQELCGIVSIGISHLENTHNIAPLKSLKVLKILVDEQEKTILEVESISTKKIER